MSSYVDLDGEFWTWEFDPIGDMSRETEFDVEVENTKILNISLDKDRKNEPMKICFILLSFCAWSLLCP